MVRIAGACNIYIYTRDEHGSGGYWVGAGGGQPFCSCTMTGRERIVDVFERRGILPGAGDAGDGFDALDSSACSVNTAGTTVRTQAGTSC